jgi:ABC-type spermidine/putrescine transport system permease subunit II
MDIVGEALSALGQIVAIVVAVLIAPLIFMIVFSLVTGFDDRLPHGD